MTQPRLTYCTNVHALNSLSEWVETISFFGPHIRDELGVNQLPLGLWFNANLLAEISHHDSPTQHRIKEVLEQNRLSVFTLNAFPYINFHEKIVKTKVYTPDWTDPERLHYSMTCAQMLSDLLDPENGEGSISTLPLGWRAGWTEEKSRQAAENLILWAKCALELEHQDAKVIRLAVEPEPGCVLETISQVVAFWEEYLRPAARKMHFSEEDLTRYIGVCYDVCHQAVQFENPVKSLDKLTANGIPVVKMQLSSALEFKADPEKVSREARLAYVEERFLHQTRIKEGRKIHLYDDLPHALNDDKASWDHPWRVHYHVPIDTSGFLWESEPNQDHPAYVISTTRKDMLTALNHALDNSLCSHFEVETYTWSVLPEQNRPVTREDLAKSLARELRFVEEHSSLKLERVHA